MIAKVLLIVICGFQPPAETTPPTVPPAPKVDRKVPPPIPQPPPITPRIGPGPAPTPAQESTPTPVAETPAPAAAPSPPVLPQKAVQHLFLRHHDINVDGRLEPAELERRYARSFAVADLNRDGFLDAYEILLDRHNIGRSARKMEGLDLDREGRLVFKTDKPPIPIANIARGVIDILDPDGDGYINGREVGDAVRREVLPRLPVQIVTPGSALPTRPTTPSSAPAANPAGPPPSTSPPSEPPTAELKTGQGSPASKTKKDDLPSAEAMILHLDKDGDGQLNETEAVDQLARNFKTLDKNRDGKLSKEEIDRGLRLARMFGIKPMKAPESYRDDSASKRQSPPK